MCKDAEDRVDDTNTANTKLSTKFVDRNLSTGVEDTSLRGESAVRSPVTAQHSTAQHSTPMLVNLHPCVLLLLFSCSEYVFTAVNIVLGCFVFDAGQSFWGLGYASTPCW